MRTIVTVDVSTGERTDRAMTPEEVAALPAIEAQPPRTLTPREFMDRLPMQRQAEVTAAAMQSPALLLFMLRLTGAREVDPSHPETVAGVTALRAAGVITEQEAAALLAPL